MTASDEHGSIIDLVPKRAARVEMEIVEGEVLLYHPQDTRVIYLNSTAGIIWGLCDGKRSVRDIIRLIGESYPEADNPAEQVIATISQLRESGVLGIRPDVR